MPIQITKLNAQVAGERVRLESVLAPLVGYISFWRLIHQPAEQSRDGRQQTKFEDAGLQLLRRDVEGDLVTWHSSVQKRMTAIDHIFTSRELALLCGKAKMLLQ
jgi:hypothetical protein